MKELNEKAAKYNEVVEEDLYDESLDDLLPIKLESGDKPAIVYE